MAEDIKMNQFEVKNEVARIVGLDSDGNANSIFPRDILSQMLSMDIWHANTDWNELITPGVYTIVGNESANAPLIYTYGTLLVFGSTFTVQLYFPDFVRENKKLAYRVHYESSWRDWVYF